MSRFDDSADDADDTIKPQQATSDIDWDRARGALLGLAVGDALGTTLEFQRLPPAPFVPLLTGPHTEVIGQGPFRLAAGQVTDDTQMATALASSLREHGGFRPRAVAKDYVAWSKHAFDIGNQTSQTLSRIAQGGDPAVVGREVWGDSGRKLAGNGSLMRTVPIAVFYAADAERRVEVSRLDSALTHYDPRCQLACAAYNGAIAAALTGADAPSMLAAARHEMALAHGQCLAAVPSDRLEIDDALTALSADLDAAEAADPDLYSDAVNLAKFAGFVRVAFRLAFWHLAHTPSYEAALIDTVNRGGDADTNGAIVGGLLGARFGASAIPEAWATTVTSALSRQSGPWATTYHPRELLALVPQ